LVSFSQLTFEGFTMLYVIWMLAVIGLVKTVFFFHKYKALELALFLIMGWSVVIVGEPIYEHMPVGCVGPLIYGGVMYSAGTIFFSLDGVLPFAHAIWHLFVLGAAFVHLQGVCDCLF
jgi:hemolysin III